jgi:ABC-type uncharacterized transport system substrate-binding protein
LDSDDEHSVHIKQSVKHNALKYKRRGLKKSSEKYCFSLLIVLNLKSLQYVGFEDVKLCYLLEIELDSDNMMVVTQGQVKPKTMQ